MITYGRIYKMKKIKNFFVSQFERGTGFGIFIMGSIFLVGYTVLVGLLCIPYMALFYIVYKSSTYIYNLAPFRSNTDSFLNFMLGYNSFVLSIMGIFILFAFGHTIWEFFFKKNKEIMKISFTDVKDAVFKFIYFWFQANLFILIPIILFFMIAGFLSSGVGETCNMLVCY